MLISVALCTYNGARFLEEQLNSIAAQSMLPHELVVCDDCSTDSTSEIVSTFASRVAFTVRSIRNEKILGSTRNFEKAITSCGGDLIALCDQDDVWYPEKLARLAAACTVDPAVGGAFSDAELIDEQSNPLGKRLWNAVAFRPNRFKAPDYHELMGALLRQDMVTGATLMFRSNLVHRFVPIDPLWVHDAWIALMLASYSRLVPVNEVLMKYRIHASQQLGVSTGWADASTWKRARHTGREDYLLLARRYESLRERWFGYPSGKELDQMKECTAKISLLLLRASLPTGRLQRARVVLCAWRSYHQYAQGWKSMAKDVLYQNP